MCVDVETVKYQITYLRSKQFISIFVYDLISETYIKSDM